MSVRFTGLRAVLFDLDGTLIDSAPDLGAAADKLRVERGLPSLPLADYRSMAGAGARGMLGVAFGMTPEHPEYDTYREAFFHNYENAIAVHTRPFDGIAELLRALRAQQLAWGIVTNKQRRFTDPLVRQMPLLHDADTVISGDTTPHPKPHPAPLLEAARQMGLSPEQCLYVGDDERDIQAGNAAGMPTVAATYGYLGARSDVREWQPDAIIDHPLALLKNLEQA